MRKKIYLATENKHKVHEFSNLLKQKNIRFYEPPLTAFPFPEEVGKTFKENAILKTIHIVEKCGLPSLADDSGLEVNCLNGEPGIFSSRYSKSGTSNDNIKKLLSNLSGVQKAERKAKFTCCLAYNKADGSKPLVFESSIEGEITEDFSGKYGFGYDPIFLVPELGLTFAEITKNEKNRISHRAKAFNLFLKEVKYLNLLEDNKR